MEPMQIPYRKPGKFTFIKPDPLMTQAKFDELTKELQKLKEKRPWAASEVARLAELGDFSENAEYQHAKGRLRRINSEILRLEAEINQAEIISASKNSHIVSVGSTVTVKVEGKQKTYQILGSSETDPSKGIISRHSPIGSALLDHAVGDEVPIIINGRTVVYTIIAIQ